MADENGIRHSHDVIDDDPHFKIDAATREITRTSEAEPVLIQYDHNSERFTFEIPRLIDGHDMTLCNKIEVNFINTEATNIKNTYGSKYVVDDLAPLDGDDDTLAFTWLISGAATGLVGPLAFAISFACTVDTTDENGEVVTETTYRWNTKPYVGVVITDGLETQELMNENYYDYVDEWSNTIEQTGVTSVGAVEHAESVAVGNIAATVVNAETAAIEKIDDHIAEVVEETRKELAASALDAKEILVQTTGQATDKVMSQKATTDALDARDAVIMDNYQDLEANVRTEVQSVIQKVQSIASHQKVYSGTVSDTLTTPSYEVTPWVTYYTRNKTHPKFVNGTDWGVTLHAEVTLNYYLGDPTLAMNKTTYKFATTYNLLMSRDRYVDGTKIRILDVDVIHGRNSTESPITTYVNYEVNGVRYSYKDVCSGQYTVEDEAYGPVVVNAAFWVDTDDGTLEVYTVNVDPDGSTYTVNANGIATITKTKTEGLVDTYTTTFDDGRTTTFTVTNGRAIVSIEKTDTINDEDIYTVYFNDGTTMTFTVPNVEANRSYLEDNVEDLRTILNEFGATTTEQATGLADVIDVPERVSKYARLNSFGGMSRKVAVPTVQGYNLLPFPYANGDLGTDGAGTFEFTGLIADGTAAVFIDPSNPWTVPNTAEGAWYKFKVWTDCPHPYMNVTYANGDGESVSVSGIPSNNPDIAASADGSGYEIVLYLEPGTTVTYFTYSCDLAADTSSWTCSGGIYRGVYISSDLDPDDPNSYEFIDSEWVPRVASYKFEHTKLQAIKSVGANLFDMETFAAENGLTKQSNGYWQGSRVANKVVFENTYGIEGAFTISHTGKTISSTESGAVIVFTVTYTDGTSANMARLMNTTTEFTAVSATTDPNKTIEKISWTYGANGTYQIGNIMLNSGDTALPWAPYSEKVYTIPTDIPTLDGFESVDYNEHVDTVDIIKQKHIRNVGVLCCTGNENWRDYVGGTNTRPSGVYVYALNLADKKPGLTNMACTIDSSKYKPYAYDYGDNGNFCGHQTLNTVYFATSEFTTRNQWITHMQSLAASGTPFTIYYELTEPVAEPLPTRLDKLIPIEPNGHLIAVTDTGEEVPIDVEFTVIGPNINEILDGINQALETLLNGGV